MPHYGKWPLESDGRIIFGNGSADGSFDFDLQGTAQASLDNNAATDGDVDGADFLLWQRNIGSEADQSDDFQATKEYDASGADLTSVTDLVIDPFNSSRLGVGGLADWPANYGSGS